MKSIGIVPAAGIGSRWGLYPKFLLPIGERKWLINETIRRFPKTVDAVVIVYSQATLPFIARHIAQTQVEKNIVLVEQRKEWDIYGAMHAGMTIEADYYYFAMPDTMLPDGTLEKMSPFGISLACHTTDQSERFGMLRDDRVVNKRPGKPGLAWGALGWDSKVRDLWLDKAMIDYTAAINLALAETQSKIVLMDYYHDFATWDDYAKYIKELP